MTAAAVHVVDDDASFRTAVGRQLRAAGYQVFSYATAADLLERLPLATPGCIVLDVRLPGMSGPELQQRLIDRGASLPIIFLTGHADIPVSVRTIKAGAEDFLIKPVPGHLLLATIERAIASQQNGQGRDGESAALRALLEQLTPREHQVFQRVVHGRLNKQIAHELDITERTVKAHRQSAMEKLKAHSLLELVFAAESLGILSRSDRNAIVDRNLREGPAESDGGH
ncbi:MAG TPA: response regulator [Bradyrhizobium sp.]|nr:response regulator [Bradyrhizobium sp.]